MTWPRFFEHKSIARMDDKKDSNTKSKRRGPVNLFALVDASCYGRLRIILPL